MNKETEKERQDRERRETPIIDGDARPDKFVDPDTQPVSEASRTKEDKKPMTKERSADIDSLEDYKDAK